MKPIITGIGLLIALASGASAQTDSWKEYVFKDDGFTISAPSEPELTSQPINVAVGSRTGRKLPVLAHSRRELAALLAD